MNYSTTITQKGQITIPKKIRDILKLVPSQKVIIGIEENGKEAKLKAAEDFLEIAKKIKVKKRINVLKAREYMEKHYERA
ncbi:hypothetical protein BWK69_01075 [Candidatus Parcubacteria bacterium A4]|nr:MAG: hypothetical protein BWK69_01075 [Candidatus Parcubacteria bacterium A4]